MPQRDWDKRYREGDLPWDVGSVDLHLKRAVDGGVIKPCRALEVGVGTGTNAVCLAQKGFEVTGVDVSPTAIDIASSKATDAGVEVVFITGDILKVGIPDGPFDFVFDRGCFHTFETAGKRRKLAHVVADHMKSGGLWLSIIGSDDAPSRDEGPPRRSAEDIAEAVEKRFAILSLEATRFMPDKPDSYPAWRCLMRRRA